MKRLYFLEEAFRTGRDVAVPAKTSGEIVSGGEARRFKLT